MVDTVVKNSREIRSIRFSLDCSKAKTGRFLCFHHGDYKGEMELNLQCGTCTARFTTRFLISGENDESSTLVRCWLNSTTEVAEKRNILVAA
jgi:hypothetical protein